MARWMRRGRYLSIWFDLESWGLGVIFEWDKDGPRMILQIGPFDITLQKEY
jgi:hypothetical protein